MKKLLSLVLALTLACVCILSFASCGKKGKTLAEVKAAGELVVATSPDFEPFEYLDGETVVGIEVEILKAINSALITDPEGEIAVIASSSPVLQEMLDAALDYGRQLFGHADFTIDYGMYMITIPFGVIGGIFADQAQKETRLIVARTGRVNARKARSMDAYKDGKALGFETFEQCTAMSVNSMAVPSRTTTVKSFNR